MDALERLTAYLCSNPGSEAMDEEYAAFAARLLRQHAHELAEKQREYAGGLNLHLMHDLGAGVHAAADHIDPQIED